MKKWLLLVTHALKNLFDFFTFKSALETRIDAAIYSLELEFNRLKSTAGADKTWVENVQKILDEAKTSQKEEKKKYFPAGHDQKYWNYIHLMEEHMALALSENDLKAKAHALRAELKKIGGSRQESILAILGKDDYTPKPEELYVAMQIRDDHYNTKYHKISLRKSSLRTLAFLLAAIVVAGICWMHHLRTGEEQRTLLFWEEAISGLFLGALGASFSMAYTLTASSLDMKIPDQIMGSMITFIRLSIGGTAAFIALLLFKSGVLDAFLSEKLLTSQYGFFIAAFIAGFSERWIVNVVQIISKEKETTTPK